MKYLSSFLIAAATAALSASAAPFQNLGFDQANTNSLIVDPGPRFRGTGPATDLLPGWQLTKGGAPQETLGLNLSLLSFGYATLISADQSDYFGFPVEGAYALHLVGEPGNAEPFSLLQRGDVPAAAQYLSYQFSGFPLLVNVNGADLRPIVQTPTMEAFDIGAYRGQTIDLTLTALGPLMPTEAGASYIDSVAFTIPEPSTALLLTMGTLLAGAAPMLRRDRSRRSQP